MAIMGKFLRLGNDFRYYCQRFTGETMRALQSCGSREREWSEFFTTHPIFFTVNEFFLRKTIWQCNYR